MENSTAQKPLPARQEILRRVAGLELEPKCELHNARRLLAGQRIDHPKRRRCDQGVGQPRSKGMQRSYEYVLNPRFMKRVGRVRLADRK